MKKILSAFITFFIIINVAQAERYYSDFGFNIDVPAHWSIMSKKQLADETGSINLNHPDLKKWDQDLLSQVMKMIESGQIEAYFNTRTSSSTFNDNINVLKQPGNTVPASSEELNQLCGILTNYLSQTFGREITSYQCEFAKVNGDKALYINFDGALAGTRSMQYQFYHSGFTYVMTATCENSKVDEISKEFDTMVQSIRF